MPLFEDARRSSRRGVGVGLHRPRLRSGGLGAERPSLQFACVGVSHVGSTTTAGLAQVLFSARVPDVLGLEWRLQGSATTPCLTVTAKGPDCPRGLYHGTGLRVLVRVELSWRQYMYSHYPRRATSQKVRLCRQLSLISLTERETSTPTTVRWSTARETRRRSGRWKPDTKRIAKRLPTRLGRCTCLLLF